MADFIVDVRPIPPAERRTLIFATLDKLKPGQSMEFINEHEPKPLFYMLQAEKPGQFTWSPLEQGPVTWRTEIGRKV